MYLARLLSLEYYTRSMYTRGSEKHVFSFINLSLTKKNKKIFKCSVFEWKKNYQICPSKTCIESIIFFGEKKTIRRLVLLLLLCFFGPQTLLAFLSYDILPLFLGLYLFSSRFIYATNFWFNILKTNSHTRYTPKKKKFCLGFRLREFLINVHFIIIALT